MSKYGVTLVQWLPGAGLSELAPQSFLDFKWILGKSRFQSSIQSEKTEFTSISTRNSLEEKQRRRPAKISGAGGLAGGNKTSTESSRPGGTTSFQVSAAEILK